MDDSKTVSDDVVIPYLPRCHIDRSLECSRHYVSEVWKNEHRHTRRTKKERATISTAGEEEGETTELIDWRRGQVIELISKGENLTQIAEILNVDKYLYSDTQYIKENANIVLKKFFAEILPLEITKCLSRLTSISDEAWKMAEQADKEADRKTKATAMLLAQKVPLISQGCHRQSLVNW